MKNQDSKPVVVPFLASALTGAGAYASGKIDNYLAEIGIPKGYTLNNTAINDIREFANATPEDKISNRSKFIYRYSDLANKASKAQLFNEDPRSVWEWFTNEPGIQRGVKKTLNKARRKIQNIRFRGLDSVERNFLKYIVGNKLAHKINLKLADGILKDLECAVSRAESMSTPDLDIVKGKRVPESKNRMTKIIAHEAELAQSRTRALVRLMTEGATLQNVHPDSLVRYTAEAIRNWKSANEKNPAEYLRKLLQRTAYFEEGMLGDYIKHFKDLMGNQQISKKDLIKEIARRLYGYDREVMNFNKGNGKKFLVSRVMHQLGIPGQWTVDQESGKLVADTGHTFKLNKSLKTVRDIRRTINASPLLTFIRSGLSSNYLGKEFGIMANILNISQRLRNKKLRLLMGLGSTGLATLGATNLTKNIIDKSR